MGAQVLTDLSGFAPPTVMAQASRLMNRQRLFNLVVTNVPGPQFPLYLMGREAIDPFPMVPLAKGQGLGVAIMSYNGRMNFGLVGDYDVMHDIDDLADDLYASLDELADAAGVELTTEAPQRASVSLVGVREKVIEARAQLGLEVDVRRLEASTATVAGGRRGRGLRRRPRSPSRWCSWPTATRWCASPPGAHRVDMDRLADVLDVAEMRQAAADEVRAATGFASAAFRPSATTCRWCSTRRCSSTSASGPPAATRTACSTWIRASWPVVRTRADRARGGRRRD